MKIKDTIKTFLLTPLHNLFQQILSDCFEGNIENKEEVLEQLKNIGTLFDNFDTEYKFRKILSARNLTKNLTVCNFSNENDLNLELGTESEKNLLEFYCLLSIK